MVDAVAFLVDGFQPGNIFNVFSLHEERDRINHQVFALLWLVVVMVINAKWFRAQVKNFRAPEKIEKPPVIG